MKTQRWMTVCVMALLALTNIVAVAKDHEEKGKGENRGQAKKHYRQFNDHQRQAARQYYSHHQNEQVSAEPMA